MFRQYKTELVGGSNKNNVLDESDKGKSAEVTKKMDFCDDCGELVEDLADICRKCELKESGDSNVKADKVSEEQSDGPADIDLDAIKIEWEREQLQIRERCRIEDCHDWSKNHITKENAQDFPGMEPLKYIGGVDISFVKGDNVNACAAFVVLSYPELEVVHEDMSMVQLTAPYIAGYLAFREADFLVEKIESMKKNQPELVPQVIAVDGNGILHPRRCGLAVHLGVLVDIPCYGIAKSLFHVDGLAKNEDHSTKIQNLEKAGDTFPLKTTDGELLGKALRTAEGSTNPVYISAGHRISLDTCIWITQLCSKKRIPEPTRQADIRSREYLRQKFLPKDPKQRKKQKPRKPKVPDSEPVEASDNNTDQSESSKTGAAENMTEKSQSTVPETNDSESAEK